MRRIAVFGLVICLLVGVGQKACAALALTSVVLTGEVKAEAMLAGERDGAAPVVTHNAAAGESREMVRKRLFNAVGKSDAAEVKHLISVIMSIDVEQPVSDREQAVADGERFVRDNKRILGLALMHVVGGDFPVTNQGRRVAVVRTLLEAGADIKVRDKKGTRFTYGCCPRGAAR